MTELYAHITQAEENRLQQTQSLKSHSFHVGELASRFASEFGCGDIARVMGMLHDKGKEQEAWQKYIRGVTGYDSKYAFIKSGPNHAYVGAVIARRLYPVIAPLIANPIAGHHRGLYDYCDYLEETEQAIPDEIAIDERSCSTLPQLPKLFPCDYHQLVRMLFSCLVDADSLDTERFLNPEQAELRGSHVTMEKLLHQLEAYLQKLRSRSEGTDVNRVRNYVQEQCVRESDKASGFYSLTVPTGGGKTLASILWALHHAVRNHLHRIIIAIPYTSIIVQTVATLKSVFGEENVLEHHSNTNPENIGDDELRERMQLATENWDYPIIVTTNVQFFESLFSNKRSECRKLHNIVKSVVILDEVQMLPLGFYKPIVNTLDTLHRIFGVSVLFTTASQPILTGRIEGANPSVGFDALSSVHEIIPVEAKLHEKLRRVKLEFDHDLSTYDEITERLSKHQRVLCIVNTRRDAKELYDRLPKDGLCLHLSRMMCPSHVASTIQFVKDALKEEDSRPVRVVATQLIEAGVDIDFPVVYRQEAGLDSVLQAAGRCNREGKSGICTTYVFSLGHEHSLPPGYISQTNNARLNIGRQHDWFSPDAMTCYFHQLHCRIDSFDRVVVKNVKYSMEELLYKKEAEFEKTAEVFRLIDDQTVPVIINWNDSMKWYEQLLSQGPTYSLMKQLAQYSVNIREHDFLKLKKMGAIEEPFENIYAITHPGFYKSDTGLSVENEWLEETYII